MRKGHLIWVLGAMLLGGIVRTTSAQWEMIGPDGSPDEIVRVDSFLYATTTYGFYRSSDDGDSWKRLDKGLPQPWNHKYEVKYDGYEFSMSARPFNLGSADSGFYVLDANDLWQYKDSSYHSLYCSYSTRVSLDSFLTIFPRPAIDSSAVYLSTDRGKTWIRRTPPEGLAARIYYINRRIFVEVQIPYNSTSKLYHSDDYGETWEENATGWAILGSLNLYNFPSFILAVGSFAGNLRSFRSTDTGNTWSSSAYLDAHPSSVSSVGNNAYAFFYEYAYRSIDSGGVWYPLRTQDQKNMHAIVGNNRGDGYVALVEGPDYGSWRLCHLDTGFTIVRPALNQKFTTTKHWLVHADDSVVIAMGGVASSQTTVFDTVHRSTDNGNTWELRGVMLPGLGITGTSWKRGQRYVYTVGRPDSGHFAVYRSSDHGEHWENIGPRHDSVFFGPIIKAITNDTIVVDLGVGISRRFFLSHDGGTTWSDLHPTLPNVNRHLCFLNGVLYDLQLYPIFKILRSADGIVWSSIDVPPLGSNDRFLTIFAADGALYLTLQRSSSNGANLDVFRSTDEGSTWTKITDHFGELHTTADLTQYGSTLYLLGENSIGDRFPDGFPRLFASGDRGETWKRLNNNFPEAEELFVTGSDLFVSSTRGGSYRLSKERATIRRESARAELVVYPNPATQQLSVAHSPGAYTYTIVSMTGVSLLSQTSQMSDHAELTVSDLPAGLYCLRVHNEQISMQTLFVVVR